MPQLGHFIALEGIDGCGKTTQARLLEEALLREGRDVLRTREPGGSPGAEEIRRLLVEGDPDRWTPETEILLFAAARFDHMVQVIDPALHRGRIVVCDRFTDSTRAYQGSARAGSRALCDSLHSRLGIREPDTVILLDMDPDVALERSSARTSRECRFESIGIEFQKRVRSAFLELAQASDGRFVVVNADRSVSDLAACIEGACRDRLA